MLAVDLLAMWQEGDNFQYALKYAEPAMLDLWAGALG